jgi:hypothetical protein
MLLAHAAMVLSLVEVVVWLFVRWVLGSTFIFSRVFSRASLALGRRVFPPKSRFAKRVSESRFKGRSLKKIGHHLRKYLFPEMTSYPPQRKS